MKKSISAGAAILTLVLLLSRPDLSFAGASQGLLLWFHTVLPTLLPFMLCSNLIVMLDGVSRLTAPFRPVLTYVLGLSSEGGYVLIAGLLCGYPMGAKTCGEFLAQGRIAEPEARYLLAICNHPSPMFLLGYVAASLNQAVPMILIILALYLPLFLMAWAARLVYFRCHSKQLAAASLPRPRLSSPPSRTFDELMLSSFEVMVRIGGYIMIFSILAAFVQSLPEISLLAQSLFLGLLEITTGIQMISANTTGLLQGFLLVVIIAFGGISGIFQTRSVLSCETKNAGLSIRHYILWKMIHALLSGILYLVMALFWR